MVNNYLYQGEDILAEYANGWAAATGFITHGATTDVPLAWQPAASDPAGPRYFHQDGLGSIVAMSTTAGTTDTEHFDAWGEKLVGSGAIPLYGYTGREQDGTPTTGTGFIYYRARYYDPANGRFTQRDPIELRGGINLYTYVGGNPISRTDPYGLWAWSDLIKPIKTFLCFAPDLLEGAINDSHTRSTAAWNSNNRSISVAYNIDESDCKELYRDVPNACSDQSRYNDCLERSQADRRAREQANWDWYSTDMSRQSTPVEKLVNGVRVLCDLF